MRKSGVSSSRSSSPSRPRRRARRFRPRPSRPGADRTRSTRAPRSTRDLGVAGSGLLDGGRDEGLQLTGIELGGSRGGRLQLLGERLDLGSRVIDGVLEVGVLDPGLLGRRCAVAEVDLTEIHVLDVEDRALRGLGDRLLDGLRLGGGRLCLGRGRGGLGSDGRRVLVGRARPATPRARPRAARRPTGHRPALRPARPSRTRGRPAARPVRTPPARADRGPWPPRRAGASAQDAGGSRRRGFP